jgi:hypothetical protein
MPRSARRSRFFTIEILEDRITPTISFGTGFGASINNSALSVVCGDLTGNGRQDMVIGTSAGIQIFLNGGNQNFTLKQTVAVGDPTLLELVDLTGNGKLDLVAGSSINNQGRWYSRWHGSLAE